MASEKLNKKTVASAGPGRHSDGNGLYLRVSEDGKRRSWIFRFTLAGKVSEMGLGTVSDVDLPMARDLAAEARKTVRAGKSPIEEKREQKRLAVATQDGVPSFGEAADRFIEKRAPGWRSEKHANQWRMTLTKYAAPIRDIPVDEVDAKAVMAVLEPLFETPTTAGRVRNRIEMVLDAAKALGHIAEDQPNPARLRRVSPLLPRRPRGEKKHFAAMEYRALPAFLAVLRATESIPNLALEFLTLTAARSGEVRGAMWKEVSLEDRLWEIPDVRMKSGVAHRVALSERAVEILRRVAEIRTSDHVFPGLRDNKPMNVLALDHALKRAGGKGTVHGLRAVFKTWASDETDHPRETIEAALAHAFGDAVERSYRRGDALAKRRALMSDWATYCCRGGQA